MIFPFSRYKVEGFSMWPSIVRGERVVINHWSKIKEGDVVVFRGEGKDLIKRVIKISGEDYFVQGDNYVISTDSRHFGPVKRKDILGKVIFRYGLGL